MKGNAHAGSWTRASSACPASYAAPLVGRTLAFAYEKAGDDAKARARAQDYLRAYPSGRRVSAVRALGGGE